MAATLTGALGTGLLLPDAQSSSAEAQAGTPAVTPVLPSTDLAAAAEEAHQEKRYRASRSVRRALPVRRMAAELGQKVAVKRPVARKAPKRVQRAVQTRTTVRTRTAVRRATVAKRRTVQRPAARRGIPARVANLNWRALAACESGGNPRAVNPSGRYFGLYQFDRSTWRSVGGSGVASSASRSEQTYRAQLLYVQRGGSGAWPVCGRRL
jgi:hypothetical protein